jgi:penicillin-binding protein 2
MDDALRAAGDFLNGWVGGNYEGMYKLLAVNSRDAFGRDNFEKLYTDAERTITLETAPDAKSYALTNAIRQGSAAEIAYDMTFKTRTFDKFTDAGRTLHLITTPDGWRIAWTPDDIFLGMKDGGSLVVNQEFPNRGNIYDRDGDVIADQNGMAVHVTLHTKAYPGNNPEACFTALGQLFKARTVDGMKKLFGPRTGRDFIYDIGDISQEKLNEARPALEKLCTLTYTTVPTRRYVAGGLAPHVIGYVGPIPAEQADEWLARGYPSDALVGIDGIERYWEDTLAGRGAAKLVIAGLSGVTRTLTVRASVPPQSVYLTIDRKLQEAVQAMLADAFTRSVWGPRSTGAAAVVMDVRTGEILAIASYPDFNVDAFNPNTSLKDAAQLIEKWTKDPRKPTFNRAALGQYPLGSVFKIVSMAAAADSGKFKLTTPYVCTGIWNGKLLGDRTRYDWIASTAAGAHGVINLMQALTGSCDTYFWHVGWTLDQADPEILVKYSKQMGFGAKTGIKGVGEASGALPDPKNYEQLTGAKWRSSDALNFVIGQGDVQVTPLQTVRMIAAIANGGTLYQPLIVKKTGIIGSTGYDAKPIPNGSLGLNKETIEGIQKAMCDVTTNPVLGTATFVYRDFKGAVVCGKTGTAQAGGDYDLPHAWFGAYAGKTADSPDIAVVVIVEHSNEGSYIAAPIVRRIIETYYNLPITPWPSWYGATGELPSVTTGGN